MKIIKVKFFKQLTKKIPHTTCCILLPILAFILTLSTYADVINPSLVEISINPNKQVTLALTINIEAILSNSSAYKNSKQSPSATYYDKLRKQPPKVVEALFINYLPEFLSRINLSFNNVKTPLTLKILNIPDIGYQGRPRDAKLVLSGILKTVPEKLSWQYDRQYGDYAYRYETVDLNIYTWSAWQWIIAGNKIEVTNLGIAKVLNVWMVFKNYVELGFLHIFPDGLDHILFIIGLSLLALSWRKLLLLVSVFTLAHSVTLALTIYNILAIPARIVEPFIALSIAYIGFEVLKQKHQNKQSKARHSTRMVVVFLFGLLHGLGFGSVLKEFELSTGNLLISLLGFNLGVELAQAFIIMCIVLLLWFSQKYSINTTMYLIKFCAFIIMIVGLLWTIERIII